jgi:hypothetical protein
MEYEMNKNNLVIDELVFRKQLYKLSEFQNKLKEDTKDKWGLCLQGNRLVVLIYEYQINRIYLEAYFEATEDNNFSKFNISLKVLDLEIWYKIEDIIHKYYPNINEVIENNQVNYKLETIDEYNAQQIIHILKNYRASLKKRLNVLMEIV